MDKALLKYFIPSFKNSLHIRLLKLRRFLWLSINSLFINFFNDIFLHSHFEFSINYSQSFLFLSTNEMPNSGMNSASSSLFGANGDGQDIISYPKLIAVSFIDFNT